MTSKNAPEIDPLEIKLAPEPAPVKDPEESGEEAAQDALASIADNLSLIQKHLFAALYMMHTWRPEITGVTYVHEVFQAIYTEADPFKEVDDLLAGLKADAEKLKQNPKVKNGK